MVGVPRGSRPATLLVRAKLATSHGAGVCKAGGGRGALFSAASCVECARADKIILSASTRLSTSAATTLSSTMLSTRRNHPLYMEATLSWPISFFASTKLAVWRTGRPDFATLEYLEP